MAAEKPAHDLSESAALYIAGALSDEEAVAFEQALAEAGAEGLAALKAVEPLAGLLAESIRATPPATVRQHLLDRANAHGHAHAEPRKTQVWKDWDADAEVAGVFIQRGESATWESTAIQGVEVRRLFVDAARNQMSMLVRMAPGTAYPHHVHGGPEECFVLEGDLRVGEEVLRSGDYQRMAPGSLHGEQSTENGCLLLINSSLSDELL